MSLESVLTELSKRINSLQNKVADHDRRIIRAPFHAGPSKATTIASGAIEATRPYIHLIPESGITDMLNSITNGSDGKVIVIANSRVGDTITINPYTVAAGNIDLNGAVAAYDLDNVHESLTLVYREDTAHWELVSGGVIPAGSIGAHAPSHQHGGSDEVATATPGANAIPKAEASGDLNIGWINQADILTDNITTSATNNFISDTELIKLAGIETAADVTDAANVGAAINAASADTPLDADKFGFWDVVDAALKSVTWANIKTALAAIFVVLAGKSGGQHVYGGTGSGDDLTLESTSHATKGSILFGTSGYDEVNNRLGIGTASPSFKGHFADSTIARVAVEQLSANATAPGFNYRKARGAGNAVNNADFLGLFAYQPHDGTDYLNTAHIAAKVNGTVATGSVPTDLLFSTGSAHDPSLTNVRMTILSNGNVGLGTSSPQGKLHIHDGTGGKLFVTKTGVVGSEVEIIPDGTGDVVRGLVVSGFVRGSAGTNGPFAGSQLITPGAASSETSIGSADVKLKVYSTGQLVVYRSGGTETWSVTLDIIWQ